MSTIQKNSTIQLSIEHLCTDMIGVIALLLLHALQKSETSLPRLSVESATLALLCWPPTEECPINGEIAAEHEHRGGVSDALLSWLICALCVVLEAEMH